MEIVKFPHPALFQQCKEVLFFDTTLISYLNLMWDTMKENNGVGLAANQVNLDKSMFVMEGPEKEKLFIVNPRIIKESVVKNRLSEGCLSAPGDSVVRTDRASWVEVEFQDELGITRHRVFKGIHAVCFQHELEHLSGKSFMESTAIPRDKRKTLIKKWGLK